MKLCIAIIVSLVAIAKGQVYETLTPENGLERGEWGSVQICPTNAKVNGYEFKYAALGNVDDTAGNGVKLYCTSDSGSSYITSDEGLYGTWQGIRKCSDTDSQLSGVRLEVLADQNTLGDDLGVTNIQFFCNGTGEVLTGQGVYTQIAEQLQSEETENVKREFIERGGRKYEKIQMKVPRADRDTPAYGSWLQCTPGYSICGLQTRIEPEQTINDDAGLTDALFFCC